MKPLARKLHFLQLIFVMNAGAESIESLLLKFDDRTRSNPFAEAREGMAEGHRIIKKWEEHLALTAFVNADPIAAAEFALEESRVEKFPIVSAAADADPLQFVRFWNRISKASSLNANQVQCILLGLVQKDAANYCTLTFNHDVPAIAGVLARLSKLVEKDQITLRKLEIVKDGSWKAAQMRYFADYGQDDWKAYIPDLRGVVVTTGGDLSSTPTALTGTEDSVSPESRPTDEPKERKSSKWLLLLSGGAAFGILVLLLIRAFLRGRAS